MANHPVVTLYESAGSGADVIGPMLAKALRVPFVDQRLSPQAIHEATSGKPRETWLATLLNRLGSTGAGFEESGDAQNAADYELIERNTHEVHEAVAQGAVILGWNSTIVLAGRPNTLHVKLDGDVHDRMLRLARTGGITPDVAMKRQVREDLSRAEIAQRLYHWDPRLTTSFDLCLNTSRFDPETCVAIILDALGRPIPERER